MAGPSGRPTHELFEHTADVGLRVRAPDLDGLFAEAGRALGGLLVENPEDIAETLSLGFDLASESVADLLVDWLGELLYVFETRRLLFARFEATVREGRLHARGWGEPFDAGRHRPGSEVKAVTYHGLSLERTDAGWIAELVLDI